MFHSFIVLLWLLFVLLVLPSGMCLKPTPSMLTFRENYDEFVSFLSFFFQQSKNNCLASRGRCQNVVRFVCVCIVYNFHEALFLFLCVEIATRGPHFLFLPLSLLLHHLHPIVAGVIEENKKIKTFRTNTITRAAAKKKQNITKTRKVSHIFCCVFVWCCLAFATMKWMHNKPFVVPCSWELMEFLVVYFIVFVHFFFFFFCVLIFVSRACSFWLFLLLLTEMFAMETHVRPDWCIRVYVCVSGCCFCIALHTHSMSNEQSECRNSISNKYI